jgi:hypothetical protein
LGLLGALHGFNALPDELKIRVINCQFVEKPRPAFLHPSRLLDLIPTIVQRAPTALRRVTRFEANDELITPLDKPVESTY